MLETISAVYSQGQFRPLEPVDLEENQTVVLTIRSHDLDAADFSIEPDRWERFSQALDGEPRSLPKLALLFATRPTTHGTESASE